MPLSLFLALHEPQLIHPPNIPLSLSISNNRGFSLPFSHTQDSNGYISLLLSHTRTLCVIPRDEEYIEMELRSSPSKSRDFEFFTFDEKQEASPSPADELFYKGKLLPLHLPPRRQMVEHLLRTTKTFTCSTAPCTTANTPTDSCNISPSESCRPSCDLTPSDTFFQWPNEFTTFITNHQPKNSINSWSKKRSILAQKLKSSRAYLRSLFTKSICSEESSSVSKIETNKYLKMGKKIADIIKSIDKNGVDENCNRRSFSGAIKRHSPTKCSSSSSSSNSSSSSSSSSFNSSGVRVNFLKRSSSSNEIEGSIDAAIAHCKKSMHTDSKIEEIDINVAKFES